MTTQTQKAKEAIREIRQETEAARAVMENKIAVALADGPLSSLEIQRSIGLSSADRMRTVLRRMQRIGRIAQKNNREWEMR